MSLSFDPAVEKKSRSARRGCKHQNASYSAKGKVLEDYFSSREFPYIEDEGDVQQFHKSCKSAAKTECRGWGEAWFYAKKEREVPVGGSRGKRWTAVLLRSD